jgi:hypothetical protein
MPPIRREGTAPTAVSTAEQGPQRAPRGGFWAPKLPKLPSSSRLPWTRGPPKVGRASFCRTLFSMIWARQGGAPERAEGRDTRVSSGAAKGGRIQGRYGVNCQRSGTEKTVFDPDEMGGKACGGPQLEGLWRDQVVDAAVGSQHASRVQLVVASVRKPVPHVPEKVLVRQVSFNSRLVWTAN